MARRYHGDVLMLLGLLIVIGLVIYSSGVIKKDCERDMACFSEQLRECATAKVINIKNDNVYLYTVGSSFGRECNLFIKMERVALGSDPDFQRILEGKEMKCAIPRDKLDAVDPNDFNTLFDYCSGPLKEGLYELIIDRMYTRVIKELQPILEEARSVLKEV